MKPNRKIAIILLLVVFLPAVFFSVYEIGSLNENERIIEETYNTQLEGILWSVNQYSQDVARSWSETMNNLITNPKQDLTSSLREFSQSNPSMKGVFYITDTSYKQIEIISPDYSLSAVSQRKIIEKLLRENSRKINKLYLYISGGYRKIEAFSTIESPNLSYFAFVADNYHGRRILCGMIVNAKDFVNQILSPKIQETVQGQFIINVRNEAYGQTIYKSDTTSTKKMSQVKPLWLLPDYKLGISYKGKTTKDMVRDRAYLNFALIVLLDILFFTGIWFVFRSIKTEMQLSQMRADFISNVSHEIRTPLALISVYIETILLGRSKPEKLNEYHQIIYQETNNLTSIVNKILNFSRIEEKKYKYHFAPLDVNEIVSNVLQRFDYHLKNKNFEVKVNLMPQLPQISADKEALFEVLMNLVDNAIKYSKEEKFLSIETGIDKNSLFIVISDKGIGIPESEQQFVFDKFFRVTDEAVQGERGSGLGLAIVKHIIESHGGKISLTSEFGKGSSFRMEFPLAIRKKSK
ncbi:MAG: HAMP domain-containing sensor histidine kinase [Bacteroidota bacterium]|nr:HAMP domain-containing sensor histidine kinase [Bacteroidota bacterium]